MTLAVKMEESVRHQLESATLPVLQTRIVPSKIQFAAAGAPLRHVQLTLTVTEDLDVELMDIAKCLKLLSPKFFLSKLPAFRLRNLLEDGPRMNEVDGTGITDCDQTQPYDNISCENYIDSY
jgi:hypothetical protein